MVKLKPGAEKFGSGGERKRSVRGRGGGIAGRVWCEGGERSYTDAGAAEIKGSQVRQRVRRVRGPGERSETE